MRKLQKKKQKSLKLMREKLRLQHGRTIPTFFFISAYEGDSILKGFLFMM